MPTQDSRPSWLKPIFIPAIIALVVVLAGAMLLDRQNSVLSQARVRATVASDVSLLRAKLEGNINGNFQLVRGLVSTLSTEPDMSETRFSILVAKLFEEPSQLRSVAAARDLVVHLMYPLAGNMPAMGLDYRRNAGQRDAVLRARDTGKLVLAGPVDLVQGGSGFLGRFPVFIDTPAGERFWGVVSAVVDEHRLYADSGLMDPSLNMDISITSAGTVDAAATPFFGPDLTTADPVTADVMLPSGKWIIAATPKGGWSAGGEDLWIFRLGLAGAAALILLPIVTIGRLLVERQQHSRLQAQREIELARLSRRLSLALDVSKVGVWELDLASGQENWDDRTNELYGLPTDSGPRNHDHWKAAVHPDDQTRVEADFRRMIRTGRYEADYRVLLPSGQLRHVRSIAALYREPGEPERVVGVNWDVTADVTRNDDLRRANMLTDARNRELEAARVRIEHNALHDSLTGLPNRRYLDEKLRLHAERGQQSGSALNLLHIDLDRFKQINDTLGHAAGDAMLRHMSAVLRQTCGETDFVARVGGDEFVVLTTTRDNDDYVRTLAELIIAQMRQPLDYQGHQCRCGVSVGIASECDSALDAKRLLINADIALYRAKARGRNRYEYFSEVLQAEVVKTKRVADEILSGLERQEFVAWFQPQFDAHTLAVVGVEALARWNHPTEGLKAPDSFLSIAEDLNVMATIDRMMLEQSLACLERWDRMGLGMPRVSVNVSLRRLHDAELITGMRKLDIAPGRISFELVESIYLDDSDEIVGWNIDQLKELGVDVEIDDFGTGYASIVSLQKLRPTRLKIDRQLVMPILNDLQQRQLLTSIIDIGKSMGIEVIAEGVETMEHAAILRDLGCDILQGYALSRPLSAAGLEAFLTQRQPLAAS